MLLTCPIKRVFYNFILFYLLYIKMSECNSVESTDLTYYQKNKDMILNKTKDYYQKTKRD